jgi:hypothetical protein
MRDKSSAEGGGGERTNTEILSEAQNDELKVQHRFPSGMTNEEACQTDAARVQGIILRRSGSSSMVE